MLKSLPEEYVTPYLDVLKCLQNCNLFIYEERSYLRRLLPYCYMWPCVILFYTTTTIYLIEGIKNNMGLDELAFVVPAYVVSTQSIMKYLIVTSNRQEIRSIILHLGRIWKTGGLSEKQIDKKNVLLKRLKFCFKAFFWMNIIGSWQYLLTPLFEVLFRKFILQQDCDFQLPIGCFFPFELTNWAVYLAMYLFQCYSMFRYIYCYLGTEFLMITLSSHLGTEFTMLHEDLVHLKPETKTNHYNETEDRFEKVTLRNLIRRHQILIELTRDLDNIFNKMIFVNLSAASITICFFGFSAKVAKTASLLLSNIVGVVASMVPIFNLCYYSDLLRETSEKVADSAYNNEWYKGNQSYKKSICIIIKRSQKASGLTSLKYNPIALSTFTAVMSTTWSYFSLASSMYEENSETV